MIVPAGLAANQAEFEFEAGPYSASELAVVGWQAGEALSRTFELTIELSASDESNIDPAKVVGKDAMLTIHLGGDDARYFRGVVMQMNAWDAGSGEGRRRFRAVVVPALRRLEHARRSRIFQEVSVPDILKKVLGDWKIEHRLSLQGKYGKRNYCVQYRESDFAFLSRLCEEEGIFYFFEHTSDKHTIVFGDRPDVHKGIPDGKDYLFFQPPGGMITTSDSVQAISVAQQVRPGAVRLRDFYFKSPAASLDVHLADDKGDSALEVYDYPGEYTDPSIGKPLAKARLEELRSDVDIATGSSSCRRLAAGFVFELNNHREGDAFNRKFLIRAVRHVGRQPEVLSHAVHADDHDKGGKESLPAYMAEFVCQPAKVPFRPARITPRPIVNGSQTAMVVGPSGEEIHTDEHGRIKVQFHWDREGKKDDKSSCWIRVVQAWAGPGWGSLYIPRIGNEVVVEFIEGDPDRPLVTACVYNGQSPPPIKLPDEKTKSTLRSNSSQGGGGSNELQFEDAKGSEQVYLHAQKDLNIEVENDKTQTVGGNEQLKVAKDRTKEVEGNQSLTVAKDDQSNIGGSQSLEVAKDRSVSVGGSHSEKVAGNQVVAVDSNHTLTVGLGAVETVGAAKALTVGGGYSVTVGGLMMENVLGAKIEGVGAAKVEIVGGNRTETIAKGNRTTKVAGGMSEEVGKDHNVTVKGDVTLNIGGKLEQAVTKSYDLKAKEVVLTGNDELAITVGSVKVQFKKGGDATLEMGKLELNASGKVVIKGAEIKIK